MERNFKVGDWVYASDWCYGQIVEIDEDNLAHVEFDTGTGGGCMPFELSELDLAEAPKRRFSFNGIGLEISGTEDMLKELVSYISYGDSEPSNALADIISEIETALNLKP